MSKKQNGGSAVWGYYIALGLCAVAIGICGYVYSRNDDTDPQLNDPDQTVVVTVSPDDVQAVATKPQSTYLDQEDEQVLATQTTEATEAQALKTASPVEGETIAPYAMEALSYNQTTRDWRTHDGMDIAAEAGTPVCAAADGTVYTVYDDDTMGMTVVISHADGYVTVYASLDESVLVAPGDTVTLGQTIGAVGNSALLESALGDHVHFSVTQNGETVDPHAFLSLG